MSVISRWLSVASLVACLAVAASPANAQAAKQPANATAACVDGSYSSAKTERGACSSHGGVKTWFGGASAAAKPAGAETKAAAKPTGTATPANATGRCNDGTYTTAKSERGACSSHGGVGTWMAASNPPAPANVPNRPAAVPAPTAAPAPVPTPAPGRPAPAPVSPESSRTTTQLQTPPSDAPSNATAQCNDGTFSMAKQHRGACSSHKGVKAWFK